MLRCKLGIIRDRMAMTTQEFADMLHVHVNSLRRYEIDCPPSLSTAVHIAKQLNMKLEEIWDINGTG
jgi:DNA-binding XRE family transcriptional regulator